MRDLLSSEAAVPAAKTVRRSRRAGRDARCTWSGELWKNILRMV
jgi:hypothetical protein